MASIKERMAALQKAAKGEPEAKSEVTARHPSLTTVTPRGGGTVDLVTSGEQETKGDQVHEGPLKKAGTGFMSAIFQSRWCVLFSDGILVVFDGQTRAHQKTSLTLAKDPSTVVLSGTDTLLVRVPPADGKKGTAVEHRFRAASAEQAEEWLQKMHSVQPESAPPPPLPPPPPPPPVTEAPPPVATAVQGAAEATPSLGRESSSTLWGTAHTMEKPNQARPAARRRTRRHPAPPSATVPRRPPAARPRRCPWRAGGVDGRRGAGHAAGD